MTVFLLNLIYLAYKTVYKYLDLLSIEEQRL